MKFKHIREIFFFTEKIRKKKIFLISPLVNTIIFKYNKVQYFACKKRYLG